MVGVTTTLPVTYAVLDVNGCPRFTFDLTPSGFTNKQARSPSPFSEVVIPISPIQVLMHPGMLTASEIASLNWPRALATTLGLLA